MDKETWNALDILYQSEKASLDHQIEQKIREEFSSEERRAHDALIQQRYIAENSPAYGSKESVENARSSAEASFRHGNALIFAKIEQRKAELNKLRDEGLDRIYQYDGGGRNEAEQSHSNWLAEQAKDRTEKDDPNSDSRQDKDINQDTNTSNISSSKSNADKSSISDHTYESSIKNEDIDLGK